MRKTFLMAATALLSAGLFAAPGFGATRDVIFGSTLSGGTFAKYSSASNVVVFSNAGWGAFEQMIPLHNGDAEVIAGVSAKGAGGIGAGSLLVFDGTSTFQPTDGWATWYGLAELGNGNVVTASSTNGGNYSVRSGAFPYGYPGFGFSPTWGTIDKMISLSNGNVASGTSNLGGSLVLHSNDGATRQQFSNTWGTFQQLIELSDGIVLAGTTATGISGAGSFAKFDGAAFNGVGITNGSGWGNFEQMVAIDNGRAVAGVSHLGGTLVMYDGNANQINTGWGTFEQMIALSNGDVVFGSTLTGGSIGKVTNGTTPSSISTGQGTFYGMAELSDGRVLIAVGQSGGAVIVLDGDAIVVPGNFSGWGQIDHVASIGDGEAFLTTNDGTLLRFNGSSIVQFSTGWGVVEQLVTVAAPPAGPPDVAITEYVQAADSVEIRSTGNSTWSIHPEYTVNLVVGEPGWTAVGVFSNSYLSGTNTTTFDIPVTDAPTLQYRIRQTDP